MAQLIHNAGEATTYALLEELERGGEGRTFRAEQVVAGGGGLRVAVKVLTPESYLGNPTDPALVLQRWRDQTHVMRNFSHAGFAAVHVAFPISASPEDSSATPGSWLGLPASVIGWVDGAPLHRWDATGRTPGERLSILEVCADGLDTFHRVANYVHRDIKPSNVVVGERHGVIIDFGLVRSIEQLRSRSGLAGTPGYLAPELHDGAEYTPATDLFAFAGIIFFQLTGEHPPVGRNSAAIRRMLSDVGCEHASRVLAGALSPDPSFRPVLSGATELLGWVSEAVDSGAARRGFTADAPTQVQAPTAVGRRNIARRVAAVEIAPGIARSATIAFALCLLTVAAFVFARLTLVH